MDEFTRDDIKAFINYSDRALVHHALERANLTEEELAVLNLRDHEQLTIQATATRLFFDESTVKRRQLSGEAKLKSCWGGLPWINRIIKQ